MMCKFGRFAPCLTHLFVPPCTDPSTLPHIQESDVKYWTKIQISYDMTLLCNWYIVTDISKETAASSFKANTNSTDGGNKLLQQGNNITSLKGIMLQENQISISTTMKTSNLHTAPNS